MAGTTTPVLATDGFETTFSNGWSDGSFNYTVYIGRGSFNQWAGGFRFGPVNIPQGATIVSANFRVFVNSADTGLGVRVYAQDIDSSSALGAGNRPTTWTETASSVAFPANPGTGFTTQDLVNVIQNLVDRTGWVETSAFINVGAENTITASSQQQALLEAIEDTATARQARLIIAYTTGAGPAGNFRPLLLMGAGA